MSDLYDLQLKAAAERVSELLHKKGLKLSSAESCTGGMFASAVTAISGASEIFEMGIVSYSSRIKSEVLGVKKTTLERYGAVSEQTAVEMAQSALKLASSDIAVSATGAAGPVPDEGHAAGTVFIALADINGADFKKLELGNIGRNNVQKKACAEMFLMVEEFLKGEEN